MRNPFGHRWARPVLGSVRRARTGPGPPDHAAPPQQVPGPADAVAAEDLARAHANAGADPAGVLPWDRLSETARAGAVQEAWRWIVAARDAGYRVAPLPPPGYTVAPPLPPGYTAAITPPTVVVPVPPQPSRNGGQTYEAVTIDGDAVFTVADLVRQLRRCTGCGGVVHRDARDQHDRFHARLSAPHRGATSR